MRIAVKQLMMDAKLKSHGQTAVKRPRGRPSSRSQKRDKLIQGATVLFNSRGISAISIGEIAKELQLARASVYHYVKDRADLVYQCYMRSSEQMADDLLEAAAAETGLERVTQFVKLALTPNRPSVAVLSEIHSLDPSIAEIVHQAHNRNLKSLRRFIEAGVKDGSIRQCDEEVIAQAVIGMLSWSQLLQEWSDTARSESLRERTGNTMVDLIANGLAKQASNGFSFDTSVEIFKPSIGDAFNREQASEFKIDRVLSTASYLFNRNGVDATSLDEIALEMGVTKGVLYHYLQDKEDLVIKCYERAFALYERFIEHAETRASNGLEAALINAHLNIQAKAGDLAPLMPQPGFASLPETDRVRFRRIAGRQNKSIAQFLKQGTEEGLVRDCETALATHIFAGAFGWIPKWLEPSDPRTPMDIADEICAVIFRGISADR